MIGCALSSPACRFRPDVCRPGFVVLCSPPTGATARTAAATELVQRSLTTWSLWSGVGQTASPISSPPAVPAMPASVIARLFSGGRSLERRHYDLKWWDGPPFPDYVLSLTDEGLLKLVAGVRSEVAELARPYQERAAAKMSTASRHPGRGSPAPHGWPADRTS